MDLEELKSIWASMDERLGNQELLKGSIIRKMIHDKSNRLLQKLLNFEVFSLIFNLFEIPLMISLLYINYFTVLTKWAGKVFVWIIVVFSFIATIWQLIKIVQLMKVDFTKGIRNNALIINRYNTWIKKEKIVAIFITPVLFSLGIWMYVLLHANVALWIFMGCSFMFSLFIMFYIYKRVYDRNIDSIRQSMEELKELEEEQE
jgi:hypothetical protein